MPGAPHLWDKLTALRLAESSITDSWYYDGCCANLIVANIRI